jgi:hypothetical protein
MDEDRRQKKEVERGGSDLDTPLFAGANLTQCVTAARNGEITSENCLLHPVIPQKDVPEIQKQLPSKTLTNEQIRHCSPKNSFTQESLRTTLLRVLAEGQHKNIEYLKNLDNDETAVDKDNTINDSAVTRDALFLLKWIDKSSANVSKAREIDNLDDWIRQYHLSDCPKYFDCGKQAIRFDKDWKKGLFSLAWLLNTLNALDIESKDQSIQSWITEFQKYYHDHKINRYNRKDKSNFQEQLLKALGEFSKFVGGGRLIDGPTPTAERMTEAQQFCTAYHRMITKASQQGQQRLLKSISWDPPKTDEDLVRFQKEMHERIRVNSSSLDSMSCPVFTGGVSAATGVKPNTRPQPQFFQAVANKIMDPNALPPHGPYGLLLDWSMGSGKTATALMEAKKWVNAGWQVLWVCHPNQYNIYAKDLRFYNMDNSDLDYNPAVPYKIQSKPPHGKSQEPGKGIFRQMRFGDFTTYLLRENMMPTKVDDRTRYRMYDPLLGEPGSEEYRRRSGVNGDRLWKTFVIIDEAHKLCEAASIHKASGLYPYIKKHEGREPVDGDLLNFIADEVRLSHQKRQQDRNYKCCNLLLLTGTPNDQSDPLRVFKLLNLFYPAPKFPVTDEEFNAKYPFENKDKKAFAIAKFQFAARGAISYLNFTDEKFFAKSNLVEIKVNIHSRKNQLLFNRCLAEVGGQQASDYVINVASLQQNRLSDLAQCFRKSMLIDPTLGQQSTAAVGKGKKVDLANVKERFVNGLVELAYRHKLGYQKADKGTSSKQEFLVQKFDTQSLTHRFPDIYPGFLVRILRHMTQQKLYGKKISNRQHLLKLYGPIHERIVEATNYIKTRWEFIEGKLQEPRRRQKQQNKVLIKVRQSNSNPYESEETSNEITGGEEETLEQRKLSLQSEQMEELRKMLSRHHSDYLEGPLSEPEFGSLLASFRRMSSQLNNELLCCLNLMFYCDTSLGDKQQLSNNFYYVLFHTLNTILIGRWSLSDPVLKLFQLVTSDEQTHIRANILNPAFQPVKEALPNDGVLARFVKKTNQESETREEMIVQFPTEFAEIFPSLGFITDDVKKESLVLLQLFKTIWQQDDKDLKTHGKKYKHVIFSDVKTDDGANLIKLAFEGFGYNTPCVEGQFYRYDDNDKEVLVKDTDTENEDKISFAKVSLIQSSFASDVNHKFKDDSVLVVGEQTKQCPGMTQVPPGDQTKGPALRTALFNMLNDRETNLHGQKVRFIIIDQLKEGVDLFDAKYLHIIPNLITETDHAQVIGRVRRYCGQSGLRESDGSFTPVTVFNYVPVTGQWKVCNTEKACSSRQELLPLNTFIRNSLKSKVNEEMFSMIDLMIKMASCTRLEFTSINGPLKTLEGQPYSLEKKDGQKWPQYELSSEEEALQKKPKKPPGLYQHHYWKSLVNGKITDGYPIFPTDGVKLYEPNSLFRLVIHESSILKINWMGDNLHAFAKLPTKTISNQFRRQDNNMLVLEITDQGLLDYLLPIFQNSAIIKTFLAQQADETKSLWIYQFSQIQESKNDFRIEIGWKNQNAK